VKIVENNSKQTILTEEDKKVEGALEDNPIEVKENSPRAGLRTSPQLDWRTQNAN